MKHIGVTYQDALAMPTYERRFFLTTLINENTKKNEMMEEQMEQAKTSGSKGSRSTRISGDTLKAKMKSGEIPN